MNDERPILGFAPHRAGLTARIVSSSQTCTEGVGTSHPFAAIPPL